MAQMETFEQSTALAKIERAGQLLTEAHTIDQALFLKGLLKEAEVQARKKGLTDIQVLAARYEILVMQKIGQIIKEMKAKGELAKGGQPFQKRGHSGNPAPNAVTREVRYAKHSTDPSKKSTGRKPRGKKIQELGLSKNESSEAQKLADKSPEDIEAEIALAEEKIRKRAFERAALRIQDLSQENLERVEEKITTIVEDLVHEVSKEVAAEEKAEARKKELEEIANSRPLPNLVKIYTGDFRIVLPKRVADGTIHLIFTDPPYEENYIELWEALALEAKRVLIEGGYLVTYSPHYIFPLVINTLSKHLEFYHPSGTLHTGQQSLFWSKDIKARWKPILIFSKGKGRQHQQMFDFLIGEKGEKDVHPWAQSVSEAKYFVQHMTTRGETVLDPMCGMGTTLRASYELRRKTIGVDILKENSVFSEGFVMEADS